MYLITTNDLIPLFTYIHTTIYVKDLTSVARFFFVQLTIAGENILGRWPQNKPNGRKIDQMMAIKNTNIFHCKTLYIKLTQFGFFGLAIYHLATLDLA
jgi:hypothetical protein